MIEICNITHNHLHMPTQRLVTVDLSFNGRIQCDSCIGHFALLIFIYYSVAWLGHLLSCSLLLLCCLALRDMSPAQKSATTGKPESRPAYPADTGRQTGREQAAQCSKQHSKMALFALQSAKTRTP